MVGEQVQIRTWGKATQASAREADLRLDSRPQVSSLCSPSAGESKHLTTRHLDGRQATDLVRTIPPKAKGPM